MNKNDFFKLHNRISAKNVSIDGEMVEFNVELGSYNIVKESGYHYNVESSLSIKFKSFMKKYYLLLMGILYLFAAIRTGPQINPPVPITTSGLKSSIILLHFFIAFFIKNMFLKSRAI